jgi:drug/metabolite transporter (DMT)-like permease
MSPVPPRTDEVRAQTRALAVLLFGACAIGFAPILVRLTETGPAAAAFWRFAFAVPLILLLGRVTERTGPGLPSRAALLAGLFIATDLAFWHYGIKLTSVANATVLSNLTPIIVTAVAWFAFKERPRRTFLAGLALAVGGAVAMAVFGEGAARQPGANPPLGDLFSAITAIWYAAYFLAVAQARRSMSTVRVMTWSTLAGLPFLLAYSLILRESIFPAALAGWAACLGLGVMHVTGQGAIAWALGRLPTAVTAVVVLIQPVIAAALGWVLFGEALAPLQMLGGAAALAGVAVAQMSRRRPSPPA